jgi:hypothetical protein
MSRWVTRWRRVDLFPWSGIIAVVIALGLVAALAYVDFLNHGPTECMRSHEEHRCTTRETTTADGRTDSVTECHDEEVCDLWARSVKKTREVSKGTNRSGRVDNPTNPTLVSGARQ